MYEFFFNYARKMWNFLIISTISTNKNKNQELIKTLSLT